MSFSNARRYKPTERITGPFARNLIQQVGVLQADIGPLIVLDNACGTGIVSSELYEMLDESARNSLQLTCGDISEGMVQAVQERIVDSDWKGAKAQFVDSQETGLPDGYFTHVLTNFGIMLMRDPTAALNECFRILKSGGTCGMTTWDTVGWTSDTRDALATITGAPLLPDEDTFMRAMGDGNPWYRAGYIKQRLEEHGFQDIKIDIVSKAFPVENAGQLVEQISGVLGIFTNKLWSQEDRTKFGGEVKPALTKYMTEKYPDGQAFELTMVAIIASARKP